MVGYVLLQFLIENVFQGHIPPENVPGGTKSQSSSSSGIATMALEMESGRI